MNYFITGTDTGAGKTYVTSLLLQSLLAEGRTAVGYKPICCGDREDAEALLSASTPAPQLAIDRVNPIHFKTPAAPIVATMIENRAVDLGLIQENYAQLAAEFDHVLVEGIGGWEVPITTGYNVAELAVDFALPVLLVVDNRLGALNHSILTARAIAARGLECAGIFLNHVEEERDSASVSNRVILEQELKIPILADILHGETAIDWPFLAR
ncbi:MAG: dethiobiotin synthetase [Verrucomicrobiales bacterium]|jgi:dethiobiotin synthetase